MEEDIVIRTRQFAKRQRTWFRKEKIDLEVNPEDFSDDANIADFIVNELTQ
jgi:tRNA A37 N6-isopentenylltransferase MiaA